MDYDSENRAPSNVLKEKNGNAKSGGGKKTIEETYTKKTQLEHILLRPDTYSKFIYIINTILFLILIL
jgi:DNA topoisomerase-2